ncbi:hypothetical protein GGQ95_000091 [Anoxybacillus rupiensis]|nr:hypothetical protein [Anoxybacillus rupiensis]
MTTWNLTGVKHHVLICKTALYTQRERAAMAAVMMHA